MLNKKIKDFNLSVRALFACNQYENCYDIEKGEMTIKDLAMSNINQFKQLRNCGKRTIDELSNLLTNFDLRFGMSRSELGIKSDNEIKSHRIEVVDLAISIFLLVNCSKQEPISYQDCIKLAEGVIELKQEYIETGEINNTKK